MKTGNEHNLISNLAWKFGERITAQVVTLIVSIILARILEPSHYGVISIVTIFITLANVLVSDGFGSALIQKKNADALDFSSVLYFNIFFSIILYVTLYICAPLISSFYGEGYEILTPVLRVLGLRIIISGVNSVQQAYVSRQMIFRKFFFSTFFGTILSAFVGISLAYNGFGVWALVAQYLTNTIVDTLVLFITVRIKIVPHFSMSRLKELLNFGAKILGAKLLVTGFQELRALIIGKVYSSSDLAFYDKGKQFPNLIVANIDASISSVLFPKMSKQQDNITAIKETARNSIRFSSYIMCPLMLGLASVAEQFVRIVLTDKWLPCVGLLRMFCIVYLFQPIHSANMQAIKALGQSKVYLQLEIIKKVIELVTLLAVMWISMDAIVISMAVLTTLFTFLNAIPNKKLLHYTFTEQMQDILPSIGISAVMVVAVLFLGLLPMSEFIVLGIQILCGIIIYILLSILSKNSQFYYLINMIKSVFKGK